MKKRTLITSLSILFIFFMSTQMQAQKFSDLDVSPMDAASYPNDYKDANKL